MAIINTVNAANIPFTPETANILFAHIGIAVRSYFGSSRNYGYIMDCTHHAVNGRKDIAYTADCIINGKRCTIKNTCKHDERDYKIEHIHKRGYYEDRCGADFYGDTSGCKTCRYFDYCTYYHEYRYKMTHEEYLQYLDDLAYIENLNKGIEPPADTLGAVVVQEIIADMRARGFSIEAVYATMTVEHNKFLSYEDVFVQKPRNKEHFTDHARAAIASEARSRMFDGTACMLCDRRELVDGARLEIYSAAEIEELR